MFVALKLVALAQAGNNINMSNIFVECSNPPKVVSVSQNFVRFFFDYCRIDLIHFVAFNRAIYQK